jgi:hypothetical protein
MSSVWRGEILFFLTVPLAERGLAIIAVELGAGVAAIARRRLTPSAGEIRSPPSRSPAPGGQPWIARPVFLLTKLYETDQRHNGILLNPTDRSSVHSDRRPRHLNGLHRQPHQGAD